MPERLQEAMKLRNTAAVLPPPSLPKNVQIRLDYRLGIEFFDAAVETVKVVAVRAAVELPIPKIHVTIMEIRLQLAAQDSPWPN